MNNTPRIFRRLRQRNGYKFQGVLHSESLSPKGSLEGTALKTNPANSQNKNLEFEFQCFQRNNILDVVRKNAMMLKIHRRSNNFIDFL